MSTILDPTNKGKSMSGLFDPGSKIVKKVTGKDVSKVADPLNILPKDTPPPTSSELRQLEGVRREGQTSAKRIFSSSLINR